MSIETILLFLVFALLSGASTWLQKRRQAKEEEQGGQDPLEDLPPPLMPRSPSGVPGERDPANPPQPRPARPVSSWEEELRRLLEGEPRAKPSEPEAPVAPPPLPRVSTPSTPVTTPRRTVVPSVPVPAQERPRQPVSSLGESKRSYAEAQRLHQQAQARLDRVTAQTRRHSARQDPAPESTSFSEDIQAARDLLDNPHSARRAVIASVILGAPKALATENAPGGLPQAPRL